MPDVAMELFEAARRVSAADVARQEGIPLKRRGAREWACCPLHGEKTPSLCFYPDGRWYCFGCHEGGDASALYAALHHVTAVEAARALTGKDGLPRTAAPVAPRKKPGYIVRTDADGFTWDRLCAIRNAACAVIDEEVDTPRLWDAVAARAAAEEKLDLMQLEVENERKRNPVSL